MSSIRPLDNLEHSRMRLNGFLSSRRLVFNPYSVSDRNLLRIVHRSGWGGEFDIVQTVVMTFTRLRPVADVREFDGIFFRLGEDLAESFIYTSAFTYAPTAFDSLRQERSMTDNRRITNDGHVAALVGKRYFISRLIHCRSARGYHTPAYKMIRLKGNIGKDARAIRRSMCEAKIEMLQRILNYPECERHLNCSRDFFDYRTPILRVIDIISRYPDISPPED